MVPDVIRDGTEIQPLSLCPARCLPDQLVPVQLEFEDFLQHGKAVPGRHRVETEAGPGLSRAFHDKRARVSVDPVGMRPYPAAIGLDKGKRKRVEHLVRAQPDVLVAAHLHVSGDALGFLPDPAVHAVAGHHEIHGRQLRNGRHLVLELNANAQAQCPVDQDVQQTLPPYAVAARCGRRQLLAADIHDMPIPGKRRAFDFAGRLRVGGVELFQQVTPEHDAPAASGAASTPFEDRDVVPGFTKFQQQREVEACRTAADARDPQCASSPRPIPTISPFGPGAGVHPLATPKLQANAHRRQSRNGSLAVDTPRCPETEMSTTLTLVRTATPDGAARRGTFSAGFWGMPRYSTTVAGICPRNGSISRHGITVLDASSAAPSGPVSL